MNDNSESEPLVSGQQRLKPRLSPTYLVVPIAMICRLAIRLPSTTTFHIIEQLLCQLWYSAHGPGQVPPTGRIPDTLCAIPEVKQRYANVLTVMAVSDGIGSMVAYTLLSWISSWFGRKPAILCVVAAGLAANGLMIASNLCSSLHTRAALMILWMLFNSLSQPLIVVFATNIYLVDLVEVDERTSALSTLWGWSTLGSALSFTIGGTITTNLEYDLPVYVVSSVVWMAMLLYIVITLPESYPKRKRDERRALEPDANNRDIVQLLSKPLGRLLPSRNPQTGSRQWQLMVCAIHALLVDIGGGYGSTALIVYLTAVERYSPQEVGYALTTLNLVGTIMLTMVIPRVIAMLRAKYTQDNTEVARNDGRKRVDIHLIFLAWCIDAAGFIALASVNSRKAQFAAVVVIGCSAPRAPILRSVVASAAMSSLGVGTVAVDPLIQGQTLAAIEIVSGFGKLLSPVLMGGILSASISTMPQLVFYVQAAIVVSGALVLLGFA